MTTTTPSDASASANPALSDSQALVRDFLSANPDLASQQLGTPQVMTGRFTNAEWASQIQETVRDVLEVVGKAGEGKKYEVPKIGSREFAQTIDHTLLKLEATGSQIDGLCAEARTEGFKSVCVRLNHVQRCITNLKGSSSIVACVIGFHEGTQDTLSKLEEARAAVKAGASELDVVLNHSILTRVPSVSTNITGKGHKRDSTTDTITWANTEANSKIGMGAQEGKEEEIPDYSAIYAELASLRSLCPPPVVIKLILETSQLTPQQILAAAHLAAAANIDFIKTSTGFNGRGASLEDVKLMVAASEYLADKRVGSAGRKMQVKASGGVRSLETAMQMLEAGATRLGTSSGLWIMQEGRKVLEAGGLKRPAPVSRLYTDDSTDGY